MRPRDPLVYGAVVLAIAGVGLLANAVPARRAASLDPVKAFAGGMSEQRTRFQISAIASGDAGIQEREGRRQEPVPKVVSGSENGWVDEFSRAELSLSTDF